MGDPDPALDQLGPLEGLGDVGRDRERHVALGLVEPARDLPQRLDHAEQPAGAHDRRAHGGVVPDQGALAGGREDGGGDEGRILPQGSGEVELHRHEAGDVRELAGEPTGDPVDGAGLVERLGDREHPAGPADLDLELRLDPVPARALALGVEPGEPQADGILAVPGQVGEEPELLLGPGARHAVDRAEGAEDVAVVDGDRHAGVRHDRPPRSRRGCRGRARAARASSITSGSPDSTMYRQKEWLIGAARCSAQGEGRPQAPGKTDRSSWASATSATGTRAPRTRARRTAPSRGPRPPRARDPAGRSPGRDRPASGNALAPSFLSVVSSWGPRACDQRYPSVMLPARGQEIWG